MDERRVKDDEDEEEDEEEERERPRGKSALGSLAILIGFEEGGRSCRVSRLLGRGGEEDCGV